MPRTPTRTFLAAIALALVAGALVPSAGASVSGDDAEGDMTIMDREEAEPPRNLTLTLRFVENGTGDPVADLPVKAMNRWHPDDGRRGATDSWERRTDGNGTVTLEASRGPVRVAVDDADWKRFRASFRLDGNLTLELPMRPTDEDLARLSGFVRSEDGDPLPNATVELDPARDCDGERCPVRSTGEGEATRRTVDGTEVNLRWRPHSRHAHVDAAGDGSYEVAVPEGTYRVEVEAPEHLRHTDRIEVDAGDGHVTSFELTPVPPDSVTLQGVIRDAETGEPIEGAVVTVENPRWGSHDRTRTDANGVYEVATKPGHVLVEADAEHRRVCIATSGARAQGGHDAGSDGAETSVAKPQPRCEAEERPDAAYMPRTRGLQVEADETRNVSLALQPEPDDSARIQGWVLDDGTGEPLPNATVRLKNEQTGDWGRAEVDGNGSFSARVPAGYHTLRVRAPGHLENATNVVVAEDGTAEVVLRAPAGEPARDHRRCCYAYDTAAEPHESQGSSGDAADGEDQAGGPASQPSQATIQGGPGGLGPYDASTSGGEKPTRSDVPAPGSAALVAALLGAAALGRRLRGC